MGKNIASRQVIKMGKYINKKGSYILEASITLPIFIVAFVCISLLINIISYCNSIVYNTTINIRELALESYYDDSYLLKGLGIEESIKEGVKVSEFELEGFDYLYDDLEYDNLISIESTSKFYILNAIGIAGNITFDCKVKGRAFVGLLHSANGLDESLFIGNYKYGKVVVFPRYGIRYHDIGCQYVVNYQYSNEFMLELEMYEAELRGYSPCLVCGGGNEENN